MVDAKVPFIPFKQFGSSTDEDLLYLFVARAKDLVSWAGVPRKGWHIRMLYQRWVRPSRERDLEAFWKRAAHPNRAAGETYILGPTAITVAIQDPISANGQLQLTYSSPIDLAADPVNNLQKLAAILRPRIVSRLTSDQQSVVSLFEKDPNIAPPDVEHDYVFEFALQLTQMESDAQAFVDENAIEPSELHEMLGSLEALCRPALVVDGQHRLLGAADADVDVYIPVVAIPNCSWVEQIYQFIVINEKAEKVDTSLLTDIFGSSLTQGEQRQIRDRLSRANVDVEGRIAAVIANREKASPFYRLVKLAVPDVTSSNNAYITDGTIRLLISGVSRGTRGWRSDDRFYEAYVNPTFPDRIDWESWTEGKWLEYWFAFWHAVRSFYNDQAAQANAQPLWRDDVQTNLTKGVTLRLLQTLFMNKMIARMEKLDDVRALVESTLGTEAATVVLQKQRVENAIPATTDAFQDFVKSDFLSFIPVRVFLTRWVKSLDDDQGRTELYNELEKAHDRTKAGQIYRIGNKAVFDVG